MPNKPAEVPGPEYVWDEEIIPMPEKKSKGRPEIYFPFGEMELGRSFKAKRAIWTLKSAILRFRKAGQMEKEFKIATLDNGGCRVWRAK